jgi:hypothetical protein
MNKTIPTARLCDTEAERKKKMLRASRLRPIDRGTYYDIPGRMRMLLRQIERGEWGKVTDVSVVLRYIKDDGVRINSRHTGTGTTETYSYMLRSELNELEKRGE